MSFKDVSHLASEQAGLFTTGQAARLGVERVKLHREAQRGVLRSPRRGVYAFESSPYTPDEELRAAWLSLDPSRTVAERLQAPHAIVICTTSAAAQYDIGDFQTYQHEFYTARRKQSRADDIRLRIRDLEAEEIDIVQGLPLTTPTRIVLDLLSEGVDLSHVSRMIADALTKGLPVEWPCIARQASTLAENYGLPPEGLISALGEASESPSDTARTAWSMLESVPNISRLVNQQIIDSLPALSATILSSRSVELSARMGKILDSSPVMEELQRSNAELLKKIGAPVLDVSSLLDVAALDLDLFNARGAQNKGKSPEVDGEE